MKRFMVSLLAVVSLLSALWTPADAAPIRAYPSRLSLDVTYPSRIGRTFVYAATDTGGGGYYRLLSNMTLTQLTRADTLRIISSNTADSSYVILYGMNTAGTSQQEERVRVSGTDSVFASKKYRFFEVAAADSESAGTVSIIGKQLGLVATLLPGRLQTEVLHHFSGALESGITAWSVEADSVTDSRTNFFLRAELRYYPDAVDAASTIETGYVVVDRAVLGQNALVGAAAGGRRYERSFVRDWGFPVLMAPKSFLGVFVSNSLGTTTGTSVPRVKGTIVGYDLGPK